MTDDYLDKAYGLEDAEATRALYDTWSQSYEEEVARAGYATPGRIAEALKAHAQDLSAPVLDFGCGTGLAGLALRIAGFSTIDGVDVSEEMLARAREKGIYRDLRQIAPEAPDIAPESYSLVVACGVLGVGAAPVAAFDTVMAILARGGLLAFSFNDHTLDDAHFMGKLNEYLDCSAARLLFREHGEHLPRRNIGSDVFVLEKA